MTVGSLQRPLGEAVCDKHQADRQSISSVEAVKSEFVTNKVQELVLGNQLTNRVACKAIVSRLSWPFLSPRAPEHYSLPSTLRQMGVMGAESASSGRLRAHFTNKATKVSILFLIKGFLLCLALTRSDSEGRDVPRASPTALPTAVGSD